MKKQIKKLYMKIKIFQNITYNSDCFFHFAQMIRTKKQKLGLYTKKLSIKDIEIIRNIEILCFIEIKNINNSKINS